MPTLTQPRTIEWLARLSAIEAALATVGETRDIPHETWRQIWQAKASAGVMREQLLHLTVSPVEIY